MIWEIRSLHQILVGEFAENLPVQDRHESRTICAHEGNGLEDEKWIKFH
jgi:hypothetical protein